MKGSAVAARRAVARERAAIVGLRLGTAALTAVLVVAGCAARVPVVTTPAFPDFVFPAVSPAVVTSEGDGEHRDAWAFLQAGELDEAERRFAALVSRDAGFFPATVGLGWVDVARGSYRDAVGHFDEALGSVRDYVPALVGRGDALLAVDDVNGALESFEDAFAAGPAPPRVERLVGELRFRVMSERHGAARAAVEAGRLVEAEAAYADMIAASPDSAFLYLELAEIKRRQGETADALAQTRRARRLDSNDAGAILMEAALLEDLGRLEAAESAYELADALNPTEESAAGLLRVRRTLRLAALPAEYRAIPAVEFATRGDLAALLGVQLAELLGDASFGVATPILTDTRDHWASRWIVEVVRAGVMTAGAGNRFDPERPLRRGELADVVAGVLDLVADIDPEAARRWREARVRFSDLGPGHLSYDSATMAVAAGVLRTRSGGRFEPTGTVSGLDAARAAEQLAGLADRAG